MRRWPLATIVATVGSAIARQLDGERLHSVLEALSNAHEGGRANPGKLAVAPVDRRSRFLECTAGLAISVTGITGKLECHWNRSATDHGPGKQCLRDPGRPGKLAMADAIEALRTRRNTKK